MDLHPHKWRWYQPSTHWEIVSNTRLCHHKLEGSNYERPMVDSPQPIHLHKSWTYTALNSAASDWQNINFSAGKSPILDRHKSPSTSDTSIPTIKRHKSCSMVEPPWGSLRIGRIWPVLSSENHLNNWILDNATGLRSSAIESLMINAAIFLPGLHICSKLHSLWLFWHGSWGVYHHLAMIQSSKPGLIS